MASHKPLWSVAELMRPRSVCVVGASEDEAKFGGRIMRNLLDQGFAGEIVPINPHRGSVFGHAAHPSIAAAGRAVDLVIVAVPRDGAVAVVDEAGAAGARGVIVVSSQFSDAGTGEGRAAEASLVAAAHRWGTRIIGPNCIGIVSPAHAFALCPSPVLPGRPPLKGPVGLVSQSGAMMGTALDRARTQGIGFSHALSIGNQADVDLCEVVDYLVDDPSTGVICSYVEGFRSPHRLAPAARRARAAGKPWLMVKAGRTDAGSAAAFSHTASIAGDHPTLQAICRELGIVLMDDVEAMIALAALLARSSRGSGRRIAVVSPSGGGCAMAADRLAEAGLALARLGAPTVAALSPMYPGGVANPIDVGAAGDGASMSFTRQTHAAVLADAEVDACLTVLTAAPDITAFARMACEGAQGRGKAWLAVVATGEAGDGARRVFKDKAITFVDTLDTAVRVLDGWTRCGSAAEDTAAESCNPAAPPLDLPRDLPRGAAVLDEAAAKALLAASGVRVNEGIVAATPDEAASGAARIGFPVVLKIVSPDIVHKSDAGGVALGLSSAAETRQAAERMVERARAAVPGARIAGFLVQQQVPRGVELLVGARRDAQFGMMLVVGAGGTLAEWLNDVCIAPAPVSPQKAGRMLQALKMAPVLAGLRGAPATDLAAACDAIARFSRLACAGRERILEMEINPLVVLEAGCVAVDARARLAAGADAEAA